MIDYAIILTRKYAGKEWTLDDGIYDGLTWLSDTAKPSKATLDGLWDQVQTEIVNEKIAKVSAREAVLDKIGLSADELKLLLG